MCYYMRVITHICTAQNDPHPLRQKICIRQCAVQAQQSDENGDWPTNCFVEPMKIQVWAEDPIRLDRNRHCRVCTIYRDNSDEDSHLDQEYVGIRQTIATEQEFFASDTQEIANCQNEIAARQDQGIFEHDPRNQQVWARWHEPSSRSTARQRRVADLDHRANEIIETVRNDQELTMRHEAVQETEQVPQETYFFFGNQHPSQQEAEREAGMHPPSHFPPDRSIPWYMTGEQKKLKRSEIVPAHFY